MPTVTPNIGRKPEKTNASRPRCASSARRRDCHKRYAALLTPRQAEAAVSPPCLLSILTTTSTCRTTIAGPSVSYRAQALRHFLQDALPAAAKAAYQAVQSNPSHSINYVILIGPLVGLNRLDEARIAAARVLELHPTFRLERQFSGVDCAPALASELGQALSLAGLPGWLKARSRCFCAARPPESPMWAFLGWNASATTRPCTGLRNTAVTYRHYDFRGLTISRRGPAPSWASLSSGLRRRHRSIDKQPQPIQSSNVSRSFLS